MTSKPHCTALLCATFAGLGLGGCFGSDDTPHGASREDGGTWRVPDAGMVERPATGCAMVCSRTAPGPDGEPFDYMLSLQAVADGRFRVDCTAGGIGTATIFNLVHRSMDEGCRVAREGGCGGGGVIRPDGGSPLQRDFTYSFGEEGIDIEATVTFFGVNEPVHSTALTIPYVECRLPGTPFAETPRVPPLP